MAAERPKTADDIRAELARTRAQVERSVEEIKHEARKLSDWREWFVKRPGLLVAGAFVAGFVVAKRGSPRIAGAIVGLAAVGELAAQLSARSETKRLSAGTKI